MQRTDEWVKNYNNDYFDRQFAEPYRGTVAFCNWLEQEGCLAKSSSSKILDVGTGKGANVYYMAKRYENARLTGVDINPEFVDEGNEILKAKGVGDRCKLETGDVYNFEKRLVNVFDGIVSYQTLSWLPGYAEPLRSMSKLNAGWIALTSLFFDGDVNCTIELEEYNRGMDEEPKKTYYNIYSLRLVERLMKSLGYSKFVYEPFEIDIEIAKPDHKIMGTYTERLENGRKLQISGPLLMSWYFILAKK